MLEGSHQLSNLTTRSSGFLNGSNTTGRIYVFLPAGFTTKLVAVLFLANFGVVGFVGNSLIYYFISKRKKTVGFLQKSAFVRNLNLYIKSLALSEILCSMISIPLFCIQITVDVFQRHTWACKLVRYFNILFPTVTINNLIVISMERYFATRKVPRTFSVARVRKLIWAAWIVGLIHVLGPAAAVDGIPYDLDDTHYTVMCKPDITYRVFQIICASHGVIQYLIPSLILIYFNISIAITMWGRQKRKVDIQSSNAIREALKAATIRGTYLLVAITLSFIVSNSGVYYYAIYSTSMAKDPPDFRAQFITRCFFSGLIFSNSILNVIIYLIQMEDFRAFIKGLFFKKAAKAS